MSTSRVEDYEHGRVPREVRLAQILELAGELFIERGYQGASMDELARRVGVTKPVIYELVGSKQQLLNMCLQRVADELHRTVLDAVAPLDDPLERTRAGGLAFFRFVDAHRRAWVSMVEQGSFAAAAGAIRRSQNELIAALITETPRFDGDQMRAGAMAAALNGAFEALALWWLDHPEVTAEELADWVIELARLPT